MMIHDGIVIRNINAFLLICSSHNNLFAYSQRSPMIWNVTGTRKGIISVISEYIHFENLTRSIELDIIQSFYTAFIAIILSVCKLCFYFRNILFLTFCLQKLWDLFFLQSVYIKKNFIESKYFSIQIKFCVVIESWWS